MRTGGTQYWRERAGQPARVQPVKRGVTGVGGVGVGVGVGGAELLGVTDADATDALESPTALVATTVNVYAVPLVSPDTTHSVAPVVVHVCPPGDAVTVYPVTALPPSSTDAVHDTVTCALPATPDTPVGGSGTVASEPMPNPSRVAAYTVEPSANTSRMRSLPSPSAVV